MLRWRVDPFYFILLILPLLIGGVFVGIRMNLRNAADHPQDTLARMSAEALRAGANPGEVIPVGSDIDLRSPESVPFVIVYDASGTPVVGSGVIARQIPTPPLGVFVETKQRGEHRVTWAPMPEARVAVTLIHYTGNFGDGYVLAGRSLTKTDLRIRAWGKLLLFLWGVLVVCLGLYTVIERFRRRTVMTPPTRLRG